MFDQTSDKVSPHNDFCYVDVTQIPSLIGHFFTLAQALLAEGPKRGNICSYGKMLGKNV